MKAAQIQKTAFGGADAIELKTEGLHLVATTAFGPRIAHFSRPGGANLLFWDAKGELGRGDWKLRGGHRTWVGRPGADESEETYAPDNGAVEVQLAADGFTLTSARDPATQTRRGFTVRVVAEDRLSIEHFVVNDSDMLYSGFLWALTCSKPSPETRYHIPLGNGGPWDTFTMVHFRKWSTHGQGHFEDDQFAVGKDLLSVTPRGKETKRMLRAERGIFAMEDRGRDALFAKRAPPQKNAPHPLACNLACYVGPDNFMVEMESMGPEAPLGPFERLSWNETWVLRPWAAVPDARGLLELF
ncbi:MAG: hypothetical protein J0L75_11890 [Spirochaetes bacterium]|nr:hypothetical protein [Spirochaetota bacterium]